MKLRLSTGEEAEAVRVEDNVLTVLSPRAFAPGSPIEFSAKVRDEERDFEGRAIASKRLDGFRFEVRLRFVNLRRADRELLLEQLGRVCRHRTGTQTR